MEERELILRIQRGEKEEFRELVRSYQGRIFALLCRQVRDQAAARDLTQETFVRAFRGLEKFRFEASFSTWLIRIALNVSSNYFSSRNFVERSKSISIENVAEPAAESGAAAAEEERMLAELQDAIGELKPIYRDVIVLCALERKTYEEVSVILDLPVGTVRSRLNTARNQLREKLFCATGGVKR